jgi:hypothetical protein
MVLLASVLMAFTPAAVSGASPSATHDHSRQPAHPGRVVMHGYGNNHFAGTYVIPGAKDKIDADVASGRLSEQDAKGMPVSISYEGTASGFGQGQAGDPTVTAFMYENNAVGMRLWTFKVTQSFDYSFPFVTWTSAVSWKGTSTSYPWWNVSSEAASSSSPATGVWYSETDADAVFQYCAVWVLCAETSYADATLQYWGDGYWQWSGDWWNSL